MTKDTYLPIVLCSAQKSLLPMVVVSKPAWTALPDELEQMIMLLTSREPHKLVNYICVAAHFRYWSVYPNSNISWC